MIKILLLVVAWFLLTRKYASISVSHVGRYRSHVIHVYTRSSILDGSHLAGIKCLWRNEWHHLSSSVDMSDWVTDGNSTHNLIVEQSVEVTYRAWQAWGYCSIWSYRHWLDTILAYQEWIWPGGRWWEGALWLRDKILTVYMHVCTSVFLFHSFCQCTSY